MDTAAIAVIASSSATVIVALISGAVSLWGPARQDKLKVERQAQLAEESRKQERVAIRNLRAEELAAALVESINVGDWASKADADVARVRFVATLNSEEAEIATYLSLTIDDLASEPTKQERQDRAVSLMEDVFACLRGDKRPSSLGPF